MRRVMVVTLSLCAALFDFRVEMSVNLGDDLSPLNVVLFENRSYYGEKASGTLAVQ